MGKVITIGLDIAKHVFQVHGTDAAGSTSSAADTRSNQRGHDLDEAAAAR